MPHVSRSLVHTIRPDRTGRSLPSSGNVTSSGTQVAQLREFFLNFRLWKSVAKLRKCVRLPSIFEPFPSTNENYAFSGECPASYWSLSHNPSSSRKLSIRHGFLRRYAFASLGD
ncbi:unnamed protein product [Prunus brigantina]